MGREPRIVELDAKQLIGMSKEMSRANDRTPELWRGFMPRRSEIAGRATEDFMSMQVFPRGPAQLGDPSASFTKWAAVEVESTDAVPAGMAVYHLPGGTYAVFDHHGPATDISTFMYIFSEWLPQSSTFEIDDREHFELLPVDYSPLDPNAHEEIWIPVRRKTEEHQI